MNMLCFEHIKRQNRLRTGEQPKHVLCSPSEQQQQQQEKQEEEDEEEEKEEMEPG